MYIRYVYTMRVNTAPRRFCKKNPDPWTGVELHTTVN